MRRMYTFLTRSVMALLAVMIQFEAHASKQPNVVLILADDLGFSDTQPYGGEISTPNLNALAAEGISFTNYHTAASCAPTRSMLLTGVDSHKNGVPNIPEAIPPSQNKHDNYKGTLGHNVVTVASLLYDAGYHTYLSGKWHLGKTPELLPYNRGFERTLSMADTGADNWEPKPYLPIYKKANWFEDGKEANMPKDFYSSELLVDRMMGFIDDNQKDGKPFFAYLPFLAVHLPVQAPKEFTQRYTEFYKEGWDALRKQRHQRVKELGIVPQDSEYMDMGTNSEWDTFSDEQKHYHAKRMAVYAGMIDAMDHHIGRLMQHLKDIGEYDNTVFIFTSDNGAEASGPDRVYNPVINAFMESVMGYNIKPETLGEKGSWVGIGPSFASAAASPFSYYKFYVGEGGMRVPLIISGKPIINKKAKAADGGYDYQQAFSFVTDITPTILDITGVQPAGERYGGKKVEPMIGRSLLPVIKGDAETVYTEDEYIGYELAGNKALFKGDYKIMFNMGPVGDDQWRLFNIKTDPGESQDLTETMPEKFEAMKALYAQYEKENNIQPVPVGYNQQRQVGLNGLKKVAGKGILTIMLLMLVLGLFYLIHKNNKRNEK